MANWNTLGGFCNTGLSFVVWDWALGWVRGGLECEGPIREVVRGVDLVGCSTRGIDWPFTRAWVIQANNDIRVRESGCQRFYHFNVVPQGWLLSRECRMVYWVLNASSKETHDTSYDASWSHLR